MTSEIHVHTGFPKVIKCTTSRRSVHWWTKCSMRIHRQIWRS